MLDRIRNLAFAQARERRRQHRQALRFYRQFIGPSSLCFDIGANVGRRTALFVEIGANVVAVEPQPDCAEALRRDYPHVTTLEAAIGPALGNATLLIANYPTLATLSPEWVRAVKASGRFAEFEWNNELEVPMRTLDELISDYGVPDFCKIDVEGYEHGVLQGLSRPLPALSFEFDMEQAGERLRAVDRVASLGMTEFNFSFGESFRLALPAWVDREAIRTFLEDPIHTSVSFGDVYVRSSVASRS